MSLGLNPDNMFKKLLDRDFMVITFQKMNVLYWINTVNWNKNHLYQYINSKQKVKPGSRMHGVEHTVVQMTDSKKNIQYIYLLLQCMICRPVLITIQRFFPIFSWTPLPLISNWCYIYFIFGISKVIRSGVILNWWTGKIMILFNSFWK